MNIDTYNSAMAMAHHALERDSYDVAVRHYEDALSEFPESAEAHARVSMCLSRMNRRFGAVKEAEMALRLDPGMAMAHIAYGHAVLVTGDVRAARAAARRAAAIDPESLDSLFLNCTIAYWTREARAMKQAALDLLRHVPEDVFGICILSRAASIAGKGAEAERLARDVLELEPENALAHESIGWAFFAQGKFRQAKEAALSAMSLLPGDESAFMLLAAASLRQRWLTGWMFWPALWMVQNSERAVMTMVIVLNVILMVGVQVLLHYEQRELAGHVNTLSWVLGIGLLATFVMFVAILRNESRNVRLVRDY